jgi:hypothetical protein
MESLLAGGSLSPSKAQDVAYGLGKSYDDLRDFERAIIRYDDANRIGLDLYPLRRSFDQEQARAFTDFLIDFFSADRVKKLSETGLSSELPLFVVGMMRSGTTLTENILSCHSAVKGCGEQAFWTERVIEFIYPKPGGLAYDQALAQRFAKEYLELVDPKQAEIRHVVDKNPGNIQVAAVLLSNLPNAKIVHLKRHPVDNLLSIWMTPVSGNVRYASSRENLVFTYKEYLRLYRHWRDVLPPSHFRTYRYEDLTRAPGPTIGSLLDFLGLPHEPACFAPEKNKRAILTPSVYQVRQPIHTGSQERWRNYEPWLAEFAELLEESDSN